MAKDNINSHTIPIYSMEDCKKYFCNNVSPISKKMLGLEYELILIDKLTTLYVPYFGERSLSSVLLQLAAKGYNIIMDASFIIGLERNNTTISLEPGGQLEFSTSPTQSASETSKQLEKFLSELYPICERLGVAILHTGYRPFGLASLVDTIPRSRYTTLMPHLEKLSALSNEQKMTASIQVCLDYHSHIHAGKSLLLASKCQPFIVALFSNSPIYNGVFSNLKSFRMFTWSKFVPDRSGIPAFIFENDFTENTFDYYTEWAINRRILFILRKGKLISIEKISFVEFLRNGYLDYQPLLDDWIAHLGTLFPEARLKNVIEVRSADTCNPKFACGLAAFWKGLLYDDQATDEALMLLKFYDLDQTKSLYHQAYRKGMNATAPDGRTFYTLVSELLDIACRGLTRIDGSEGDILELEHLRNAVKTKKFPADILMNRRIDKKSIIESMSFRGYPVT